MNVNNCLTPNLKQAIEGALEFFKKMTNSAKEQAYVIFQIILFL